VIFRIWRGQAANENAVAYQEHLARTVFPKLRDISGYRGAYLLRRDVDGNVEFLALTLWESMHAVQSFSGADPNIAVVEPEARKLLDQFDGFARHYEVVVALDGGEKFGMK